MASITVFGVETVDVSGDYGQSWINQNPYQGTTTSSTTSSSGGSGLWSWGGTPKGYEVVDGTLQPINTSNNNVYSFSPYKLVDYDYLRKYSYYSADSFYSDDPWILSQHYGVIVKTDWDDLPTNIQDTITIPDDDDDEAIIFSV